jgi:hypothetical protein
MENTEKKVVASGAKWEKVVEVCRPCLWGNTSTPWMRKDD